MDLDAFASEAAQPDYIEPPDELVNAVKQQESGGRGGQTSSAGARGIMQVEPDTAKEVAGRLKLPYDENRLLNDDAYNTQIGRRYLGEMLGKYRGDQNLAL